MEHPTTQRIRFGTFDFDRATCELRREGAPVRLQPQPAQVLSCLLARPGEIVTRDELRAAIWGTETFVDFDRNLNFCVAQIRSALGDSAESPIFIKTVHKRGYQFIAPVAVPPVVAPAEREPEPLTRVGGRRKLLFLAALIAGLAAIFLLLPHKVQSSPTRIAVVRFDNLTGASEFDRFTDALTGAVIGELTTTGEDRIAVIGNATILKQPRQSRDLMAIHSSLGVGAVVLGEVQRSSEGIHVFAQLIGLPEQSHRKAIRIRSAEVEPVRAQAELARRIRIEFAPLLTLAANPK